MAKAIVLFMVMVALLYMGILYQVLDPPAELKVTLQKRYNQLDEIGGK